MNTWLVTRPSKPKETTCEADASNDDRRQAPFRDWDSVIGIKLGYIALLGKNYVDACTHHPYDHTEEGKAANSGVETVDLLEDDRICCQEKVEESVDEGHIDGLWITLAPNICKNNR